MKLSCLPVSLFNDICSGKMDIIEWARVAKSIGYDGIDISILFLKNRTPVYLENLKENLRDIGMQIVMMTTYPDFTHPDKVQRERELVYLKADVALCNEIGIKYLRILAGQAHPETTVDEGILNVLENFHEIASFADQYKVGLLFEDHAKPGAWNRVDFCYPPEIFLKICEGIRDTSIKINFDTGNITAYGMDTLEILKQVIDITETIHVTDMAVKGKFSPVAIGSGVVPNKEVFNLLKQHHFNGWISIEEASGKGLEGIKLAYDYVISAWNS